MECVNTEPQHLSHKLYHITQVCSLHDEALKLLKVSLHVLYNNWKSQPPARLSFEDSNAGRVEC